MTLIKLLVLEIIEFSSFVSICNNKDSWFQYFLSYKNRNHFRIFWYLLRVLSSARAPLLIFIFPFSQSLSIFNFQYFIIIIDFEREKKYRVFQIGGIYTLQWLPRIKNCAMWNNTHIQKKSMPLYIISILFENNTRGTMTIISNTNAETCECIFINFLQHFLSNFTNFCLYSTF